MDKVYIQARICLLLCLQKQIVSYWSNIPIKKEIEWITKFNEQYKEIVDLAKDKLTSDIGARKIADIINKKIRRE